MTTAPTFTVADLAQLSEPGRHDLIRGELVSIPPAGGEHGRIALTLGARLHMFVQEHSLGTTYAAETGFSLDAEAATVLAPDVAYVRSDRLEGLEDVSGFLPLAPDLVAEVVSPYDRASIVQDKVLTYLEDGVELVLVVDPQRRSVTAYGRDRSARLLVEGETLSGGDVLPGFELAIADLFS